MDEGMLRVRNRELEGFLSAALARVRSLEALLWEAYEEDHRGFDGPVGDLGERIYVELVNPSWPMAQETSCKPKGTNA